MTISEDEMYITSINEIESRIVDDTKFPIVRDNKIKRCCEASLELTKLVINYLKYNIRDATKESKTKNKDE